MAQRKQLVTGGEMRTPVTFYVAKPSDDFLPGETDPATPSLEQSVLYA